MVYNHKDGQHVFVAVNGIAEECIVSVAKLDENSKRCLLYYGHENEHAIIATPDEMFETEEECQVAYAQSQVEEYQNNYEGITTIEDLLAKLLYMTKSNSDVGEMEFAAMIERTSEFTNMNFHKYLKAYEKDMAQDGEEKKKPFKRNGNVA